MQSAGDKTQKRALGRGLSALIPQAAVATTGALDRGLSRLPLDSIQRDEAQPRKEFDEPRLQELARSIKSRGVIQPVLVRKNGQGYKLIAGERRWRAAKIAGLKDIPAIVREANDAEAFELALIENLQRTDLNPLEEAQGYQHLVEEVGLSQDDVARRVGKDKSTISNALRLLALPDEVKEMLRAGELSAGHARSLLGAPARELHKLAVRVAESKLSVRQTEELVRGRKAEARGKAAPKKDAKGSAPTRQLIEDLQRRLGTKVRLRERGGKGTLEIEFYSYADLERVCELIRR